MPPPAKPAMLLRRWCAAGLLAAWAAGAMAGPTLDAVRARGHLLCGVNTSLVGFSAPDAGGHWTGLDVDICRALAAAVLGDAGKVRFVPLNAPRRFAALQAGEVDLLSRNTTITLARDASLGLHMTAIVYYDGQAFMVPTASRIRSTRQLKDKTVCVQAGSTTVRNLADFSRANRLNIKSLVFERFEDANDTYFAGKCDAYTNDASQLASVRARFARNPAEHAILPELIAKEPLGPLVRRGDEDWTSLVRWLVYGLLEAEELGISQASMDQLKASQDPAVQRIVGTGEDVGRYLGLDREWLARAIRATGNYGEIFDRNLGPKTTLNLPRGLNNLWNKGGLHYAPPVR